MHCIVLCSLQLCNIVFFLAKSCRIWTTCSGARVVRCRRWKLNVGHLAGYCFFSPPTSCPFSQETNILWWNALAAGIGAPRNLFQKHNIWIPKTIGKIPSNTLPKTNMAPENGGFPIGISFSRGLFSGATLVSGSVHPKWLKIIISQLRFKSHFRCHLDISQDPGFPSLTTSDLTSNHAEATWEALSGRQVHPLWSWSGWVPQFNLLVI